MSNYNFECKTCTRRFVGCHSVCDSYLTAKAEGLAEKERINAIKAKHRDLNSFRSENVRRALRSH